MEKQRYLVVIVRPPSEDAPSSPDKPSFLLPFSPQATVNEFVQALWERLIRRHGQRISLSPDSHHVTLHLGDEAGPTLDIEDVLSDVVLDAQREKLFAVFSESKSMAVPEQTEKATNPRIVKDIREEHLSFRIITPSSARGRDSCPVLKVPISKTIRELRHHIAEHLAFTSTTEETFDICECNCKLAAYVASGPSPPNQFVVIHGKSVVERMPLGTATEAGLKQLLSVQFGHDIETRKWITLFGNEHDANNRDTFVKTPVVSICSRQRHAPARARVNYDESGKRKSRVLDLHTSELPIHPATYGFTIEMLGLKSLASDGIVDIFALPRITVGELPDLKGKSSIFRYQAHWEPASQSDRGMAMFLSSLRVFTSVVQDMSDELQDAVLYAFDLLTRFPPALRCLHILIHGRTPSALDCAALSQAIFTVLDDYLPLNVIGKDRSRLFEGSRLVFGYILETARSLSQLSVSGLDADPETSGLRYTSAFALTDLRDHKTMESVSQPVQTSDGLMEANLFRSLQDTGVLAETHMQSFPVQTDIDPNLAHFAIQSGGSCCEVTVLFMGNLKDCYNFQGSPGANGTLDLDTLRDLGQLAEICSRNKLAVHMPSQLSSAVAPRLAFDRNAHLAVYTGEQPCGEPGKSSIIFRPQHGEETIDPAVLEQLIAPIIKEYEEDGTASFDATGGAEVRRLRDPDEILMFCVDTSASMGSPTDFDEVNAGNHNIPEQSTVAGQVEVLADAGSNRRPSLYDTEQSLVKYECFDDMVAIVAAAVEANRDNVARKVLSFLSIVLDSDIADESKDLERLHELGRAGRRQASHLESKLQQLRLFCAGVRTYKEPLVLLLRRRATRIAEDSARHWTWSFGDPIPVKPSSEAIPILAPEIAELPNHLRCPISHNLMEDAVKATDGQTYSRSAISKWFSIRKSSPLLGAPLDDISLTVDAEVRDQVASWIAGEGIGRRLDVITVTFNSRIGSFNRNIARTTSLGNLYKLAYRGLLGRFEAFELSTRNSDPIPPTARRSVASIGIEDGDHITVRLPEESAVWGLDPDKRPVAARTGVCHLCLVKVYWWTSSEPFSYWVNKDTTQTVVSVIWKYWRFEVQKHPFINLSMRAVAMNVLHRGDGWYNSDVKKRSEQLASFLNRHYCLGRLESESVYEDGDSGQSSSTPETDSGHLVLKVLIEKPRTTKRDAQLTRLDVLKQMFEALINRMLAYSYKNHVGLVTFSSEPQVAMSITHVLENFRRATNELSNCGDTALWDALALAGDQIEQYALKYPDAKKRIIVISDGMDTKSTSNTHYGITTALFRKGISVDSVCLGGGQNADLRTLSYLLGSYSFRPSTLANAMAICEMEPFLSLTQRPPITFPLSNRAYSEFFSNYFISARSRSVSTKVTDDCVPPIKRHPRLDDDFVQLTALAAQRKDGCLGGNTSSGSTGPRLRVLRLMNEMRTIAARINPKYDVYVSTADISFWKVVIEGPDGSPYSDGTFMMYLHAEEDYPTRAPKARFVTKIKHPNINAHGRVCHSIFDRDWTSDTSMALILDTVYGLLYQPEDSDPANTIHTLEYHFDELTFDEEARKHVRKHSSMTRDQWRVSLLGEDVGDEGDGRDDSAVQVVRAAQARARRGRQGGRRA